MSSVKLYRADLNQLVQLAQTDLKVLWRQAATADEGRDLLLDVLPQLTQVYGSGAATLAADWYDELRVAANVRGSFSAIAAELPGAGRTDALARWAVSPLFSDKPDFALALDKAQGGFQRVISNAGRDTVTVSSVKDPRARGWQREGDGECEFCSMLIGRGAVYSEATADFQSHDHCQCSAVPVFD